MPLSKAELGFPRADKAGTLGTETHGLHEMTELCALVVREPN
jgi:hypothetical protein